MKILYPLALLFVLHAKAQVPSSKTFANTALVSNIVFNDPAYNQTQYYCGFLLKYQNDTFAVTAKHVLQRIHPALKTVYLEPFIKSWRMYVPGHESAAVSIHQLINANRSEDISGYRQLNNDFLVFSIDQNQSKVKPLEPRLTPLNPGEKLYVLGWTGDRRSGAQQVFEFQFEKTQGQLLFPKTRIVPDAFEKLGGAPVVDEQGLLVGVVTRLEVAPVAGIYFAAGTLDNLLEALKGDKKE